MPEQFSHIYWFAYYTMDSPSVRYRGKYFLRYLHETYGVKHTLVTPSYRPFPFLKFLYYYFQLLLFRPKNSLIVIQRVQSSFLYANLLKLLVRLRPNDTVYDLDDADYLTTSPNTIHFFMKHCRWVAAGSAEIAAYVRPFNPHCLHLTSPTPDLGIRKKTRHKTLHIGWIGDYGGDHQKGLNELLFPALKRFPYACKLTLIGVKTIEAKDDIRCYFKDQKDLQLNFVDIEDWTDENFIQQQIVRFDVGIATLLPTPVQLAKSGIKAKQYLNNGVPVLSSNLPENSRFVHHGINGYLAETSEDFLRYLLMLHRMPLSEYQTMSEAALESRSAFNNEHFYHCLLQLTLRKPFPLKLIKNHPKQAPQLMSN